MRPCLVVLLVAAALPARGAPPPDELRQRLDALEGELHRAAAELPATVDALHDLENRVTALAREVDRLAAAREADPLIRQAIDELRTEVDALAQRAASAQERLVELAAAQPAVQLGYDDDGLFLRTPPVKLTLMASLQPRYAGVVREGAPNSSGVDLHHAELVLGGELLDWASVRVLLDFGSAFLGDGALGFLRDAYVDVRPLSWLTIRAGQFKVPFGRQIQIWSQRQFFVERSLATRAFTFDRDLGAMAQASLYDGRLLVQAAVTDGVFAGPASHNDNLDLAYTARIVAQPLGAMPLVEGDLLRTRRPLVSFGAAGQYDLVPADGHPDLDHNGVPDNVEVISANAEAALKWRGLALSAEYFYRHERYGAGLPARDFHGVYAQATMFVWRGLGVGARASWAQPHGLGGGRLGAFGDQPDSALEAGGVLDYYLWREHVKAQLAYTFRRDQPVLGGAEQAHLVEAQLQAGF